MRIHTQVLHLQELYAIPFWLKKNAHRLFSLPFTSRSSLSDTLLSFNRRKASERSLLPLES